MWAFGGSVPCSEGVPQQCSEGPPATRKPSFVCTGTWTKYPQILSIYFSIYVYRFWYREKNIVMFCWKNLKQFIVVSFGNCMSVDAQVGNAAQARQVWSDFKEVSKKRLHLVNTFPLSGPQDTWTTHPLCSIQSDACCTPQQLVSLKDLNYVYSHEFKVKGRQIGDNSPDISCKSVCRHVEEAALTRLWY